MIGTKKQEAVISNLAIKANPISSTEINELRRAFEVKLATLGKTQRQWCEENDINQGTLSNALSVERGGQRNIISVVARYVLDDDWK